MLALKTVLTAADEIPILIFDEIDVNVGGEVATRVGRRMTELAEKRQIFCITHLPQVAAGASQHFLVVKKIHDGRTFTHLQHLDPTQREKEIARMLGGQSESARTHASALLKEREK